jgi:hypothetical protein
MLSYPFLPLITLKFPKIPIEKPKFKPCPKKATQNTNTTKEEG